MPGKVNPVIPEVVTQVAAQVIGNDAAIAIGGMQGHFELNVFIPLMARNLLDSIRLLAAASRLLAEKCVDGIEANREQCERYAELTLSAATALNPYIGYDRASEIVKKASRSGRSLREVAREEGVDEAVLDEALDYPRDGEAARAADRPSHAVAGPARGIRRRRRTFCRQAARVGAARFGWQGTLVNWIRSSAVGSWRSPLRRLGPRRRGRRLGVEPDRARSRHAAARRGRAGRHLRRSRVGPGTPLCPSATLGQIVCYSPSFIRQAYDFPDGPGAPTGAGQTILVVEAYGSPTIADDLAAFDAAFGIPAPPSLTVVDAAGDRRRRLR